MNPFLSLFFKGDHCRPLVDLEGTQARRYQSFKTFLNLNHRVLSLMADLEEQYYSGRPLDLARVRVQVSDLNTELQNLLKAFQEFSEKDERALAAVLQRIKDQLERELNPRPIEVYSDLVLRLEEIPPEKRSLVGAKAGNLSAIKKELGLPVPEGFAITTAAYRKFLEYNRLPELIEKALSRFDPESITLTEQISAEIRSLILGAEIPADLEEAILKAFGSLKEGSGKEVRIAVRSSAVGEDTEAGFAGQFQTVLNVRRGQILEAYKTVLASKYSGRALLYRYYQGFVDQLTPMAVAGIQMIEARASGVLYTRDPEAPEGPFLKISAIRGLGEQLVDGSATPDRFLVDRGTMTIREKKISTKKHLLVGLPQGGTVLGKIPESEEEQPSLRDEKVIALADYGLKLEAFFGSPQDMEWAMDQEDRLFILQSRPLNLYGRSSEGREISREFPGHPRLLSRGQTASRGIAAGPAFVLREGEAMEDVPPGAILVARTAAPHYAGLMGRIKGIITDIGSTTSHLASVAREFRIPALFDTESATSTLKTGDPLTLFADAGAVYQGVVEDLVLKSQPPGIAIFESPIHRRMRTILDLISPLNLTDPTRPTFAPEGCRTLHDLTRYTHEIAVREMFGLADKPGKKPLAVRLNTNLPLVLYVMDLGGGLKEGLSTCETITPDHVESRPMKALWKGFTHPGITWRGSINFDMKKFMTLMAVSATSEFGDNPGGDSYALLSGDYLNLSIKFGYHFATLDTLCAEESSQNYIALRFSGGAGNFLGRSLRIIFLVNVLKRLGFEYSSQGDLLEASLTGYDQSAMEEKLDQLGRLLASSRLLDMAINHEGDVQRLTELFFQEDYDFLAGSEEERLPGFYIQNGDWKAAIIDGTPVVLQEGAKSGGFLLSGLIGVANRLWGAATQERLDTLGAYYYFPLAIARNSEMEDGTVQVEIKAVKGNIDQAGGLVCGLRNAGNYYVLRINALEDNVILFEYVDNKRFQRVSAEKKIETNRWYRLRVEMTGSTLKGLVDEEPVLEYQADRPIQGYVGLWTKADSVTAFRNLNWKAAGSEKMEISPTNVDQVVG
jgi:pyruvate, water dikinase